VSREVHLDFRRERRASVWPGLIVLAAALAGALALGLQYRQISSDTAAAEARLHASAMSAHKRPSPAARQAVDAQAVTLEIKRATEIATQLRLPWNTLFQSIEGSPVPDVALLSIESDTDKRKVKISAEGRDTDAMLAYLGFLEGLPTLRSVFLESHAVQQQDPQRPVRFVVAADWVVRDAAAAAARGL
jgi:Tfp pilus assembly protein PilN